MLIKDALHDGQKCVAVTDANEAATRKFAYLLLHSGVPIDDLKLDGEYLTAKF